MATAKLKKQLILGSPVDSALLRLCYAPLTFLWSHDFKLGSTNLTSPGVKKPRDWAEPAVRNEANTELGNQGQRECQETFPLKPGLLLLCEDTDLTLPPTPELSHLQTD